MAKDNWPKSFPTREEIDKALKELENVEGTLHFNEDEATPLDRFRWELCQKILKYMHEHKLKQKDLAELLSIDEPEMSRILHHRIDKVSTDKLVGLVLKFDPKVRIKVT